VGVGNEKGSRTAWHIPSGFSLGQVRFKVARKGMSTHIRANGTRW